MKYDYNQICTKDSEVEVGKSYQYKEGSFIADVKVLQDNSNSEWVEFLLEILDGPSKGEIFDMSFVRLLDGKPYAYSGMARLYDLGAYYVSPPPFEATPSEGKKSFKIAGKKVGVRKLGQSDNPVYRTPSFEEYEKDLSRQNTSLPANYNIEGTAYNNLVENQEFHVARTKRNGIEADGWFRTSPIKDIMVRENQKSAIFTTLNSVYALEILD